MLLPVLLASAGAAVVGPLVIPLPELDGTVPVRELAEADAFVRVGGIDVHTVRAGTGSPAFLLLHPFFGSTFTFRRLVAPLAERGRVVAYDRPGFGLTERPAVSARNPYTRGANAELAVGLLDELGIDRAVLVGCSAGGTVAFEIALRAPDRVAGLVLLAPAVNGDVGPPGYLRPLLRSPQARRLGPLFLRRLARGGIDSLRASYHDPQLVHEDDLAGYRLPLRARRWDRGLYETMVAEAPPRLGPQLRRITAPALVLVGSSDRTILPEHGRRTAEALGDATFHEIPQAGHLAVEERPDAIVSHIDRFLAANDLAAGR
ncbi:MAG: alpha/beta hydrolase [Actinobacteria bacterium]|nr:alpha/beta hydrolase [Actinomycetota bacterium]